MNVRELVLYQKSTDLAFDIFELTKSFPSDELHSLTSPILSPSRSVGAQITAAWSQRLYESRFIEKLVLADSKLQETMHWLSVAHRCSYLSTQEINEWSERVDEMSQMIYSVITKSSEFCGFGDEFVREPRMVYGGRSTRSFLLNTSGRVEH